MADFDPLAALKSQDRFTLGMQQGNNALQELMSRGGIQDILARRENVDKLGQLDVSGRNAVESALAGNLISTPRVTGMLDKAGLDALTTSRKAQDMSRTGSGAHAAAQAGIFPKDVKGKNMLDLPNLDLIMGEPIGVSSNRALAESTNKDTSKRKVKKFFGPDGREIKGITEQEVEEGSEQTDSQKGGRVDKTRATLDALKGKGAGTRIGQVNGKRALIWSQNGKQVYEYLD